MISWKKPRFYLQVKFSHEMCLNVFPGNVSEIDIPREFT